LKDETFLDPINKNTERAFTTTMLLFSKQTPKRTALTHHLNIMLVF